MERMNHLKRVMAWVMTAAMLVSSCPTTAIADEVVSQVQKPVAQTLRSGETYGSLQEAYEAELGTTTDETHKSFEELVRDVEKNGKDTLISANLRPAQNEAQWKTGEVVPFTLSMTFQLATNLTEYRAFDLNSMTFDEYIRYRPFDSYDDIKLQISAPGNLRISATDNGGWTDTLNVDSVQSVVPADGSNAVTLNYTFFGRMIDNGEHADGDLITPTVSLSASITPKMHYYDKNGEEKVHAGTPIDYRATIRTNAFRNAAEAKTWDVQNEAVRYTVNGDEVTFTYQVRTGALGTRGEILRQNSDYVDKGVLDLSSYTLQETIQPVAGKNGAKVYPKQATVKLGDSAYTCGIVENEDGTRSLVMPANGGNTIHNTAALDGDNTAHPSVYAYNNYTVNLIYDRADFELDCDDERLDDAAFKGLGVTLDSTLNYTVYGDSDEKKADSSKTLYYHFVRQGGYILPEQYVKLAADVADRTAYSGSDAVFAIYKASEVTPNEKGELVLGENAKRSDRIGAFETSRELPEGDYYVVRTGMEAGYTNVEPGDKKTIKIGEASYPYQLVAVKAGTKENAVKAEFEDYNAQNGQFILEKKFYAPDGTQDTNSSLSAEFTLTAKNGRTYTVKVENGKPTTVYLPADTYTMKETGVSDGFAKADDKNVLIEAGRQTLMTGENAVKNYSTEGLLNLKAYLRKYERGDNLEADPSHYTVTITRKGETEPVEQTTLDKAESVHLPRFDGDENLITYRVKVESNEQTDGLFYASRKNDEEEKPEAEIIEITFTDDARIQNADYFFIKQQELTITKRLVDVSGLNKERTWTITVQATCEKGDALPSQTVELTTDGKQNEASQTLLLRGWDENGHVVTYTVVEAAAEGYAVTYSEESVTLDDGTDKTITVTNTRQVGKTTFTKEGSDNATLPGAVYAVLTRKADGTTYLVGRTLTDGVLTGKTPAIVDEAGRLTQPENVAEAYRFTTDADGRIELVLPVEEGTSYYLQELAAPENYYLNTKLVWLTVAAGDDSQKAGQVDQRKYQLNVTKVFPDEVANGSFATFTLYDETMRQVGEPVTVRKPDQAVGVFTIPAYGTYFVRETAVSGDMMLNDSVFGPLTYSETNRADNPTVVNTANVGSLTVELRDEKKEKLGPQPAAIDYVNAADLAKFTVSVGASNLAEDSYAYRALLKTGFVLDETTNTLVYTGKKGANQAFELSSLPIYGDPNDKTTALTYTVKQEQAAQRYFKAEDGQQFKLDENASQTLTFENEPKAALNVSLNYRKEYELERGNAPEYPLTGATMTLYEVKDDGTLEQVESINMTNPTATISDLHGLKHYVLVETEVPDGYCAYESKDPDHAHSDNATYNREPHDYQDVLDNFKYVELTGEETDNQNDSQSSITNYKDYVQLKLNKSGYTVRFADGAATEGNVIGEPQPLDYCQFEVYAIRTSDLTERQRELLDRNSAFIAPQAGQKVEKGTYTGREAVLEAIFTDESQKSKLITDGITYETGASGVGTGAFMTDAFELGGDVGEYTFLFREVKINHAGGYQKVYGGVWSAAARAVNAVTEVDAYNEADVLSGGETEFKGLFQVKLDKEYWPSTEAKDNNRVGELKPLAGVTFELLLARENANGLLEAVTGDGAFSTEFVTGCESGMSAGYGVSITVSLETLYKENGGADKKDNPVKLGEDENGQPFYEADFILREKDYPINMVYMQERYALHVKAVKNAQGADYVTVVDDYLNKDGQDNAIKNILGEMTYLTVAKYVDGERYYGGEESTDAVYTITDAKGKVYTRVTLNNANHYETTVQLPRQTKFTIEETTAPVIGGVQTDKSGFVFDGEKVNGTSANRLTFTTGEYKSQIAVCSTNTRFHSLTVIKRDADEKLVKGAPIQIGYSDGKSEVLSSNGSALANTRQTTNEKGEVIFSLPIWDYRTSEAGNYPKAEYAIAETLDEKWETKNWNPNAVVNRYFKLLNGGKLTIAGADVQADKPITVYNPATTSVTIHKVSDRSGDTADLKPIAAYFALYFCPFKSQNEFEGKLNYPQIGYVYLPCTGTTDAETGEITFDGLYSGWYKLVETIPQGQVNAGQLFTTWFRVICDEDYEHLDKSGKRKSYTSEVQLLASETLKNRFDAGRQDANNRVTITDHTIDVTNTPRAYLEITKTFEPSQTQSIPKSVAFYVYKKGTTEAAELEMRVYDHGTESWQKVTQPITLGGFTETERSQSVVVRLDPGAYTVVESTDESAGYWFAKSAAYQNGKPETTPVYNGTTVADGRIISSRDVTVTRYNAMDVQRQMKVDFVNVGTLMEGQIKKTKQLSESETPTALENCFFSLYTLDKQKNKRYYAGRESGTPFGDWTGTRENAVRFKSGADGMVQLNEVYAPEDAMTDGTLYTYYVEEISAPNYSYQLAYDAKIDLAAGSVANTISMVNTRGVSIQVRVFGSVSDNRDDDTPVVEGAVLHIRKKDAEGGLHEVLLSDGQPYLYQMVTSDANGDVLFPYLPRLEEGEAYVVFEQPDAGAIGDDPAKPYLNPVSRGYKAYYDFKKTDANHSTAEQDVSELDGAAGYYTVVTGEELMANPNELFSTLHFNAYNEPKGRLVILKRDYENKSALVGGAKFSAAETDGTDETHRYAFADLEPTAEDRTEAPQTLEIGEKTYTLAKDRTYYTDKQGYRYTYVITSYVEHGSYAFAETTTPAGYIETEASKSAGMPWHTEAEAELTNEGGFAAAAFANIPNRDPYLDKTVSAVNGEADGKLGNLQNTQADGSWQTVTFEIRKTTSDSGAADANDAIRYPMSSFVITDNKVEYQTVDARGNKSGWLDGGEETVQTQHFVEGVTVGKMSFAPLEEAYGTAAEGDRIYADVYGMIGTQETLIQSNIDVTGSSADVSLKAEDGVCIYTGFKIAYHMQNGRDIPAGLRQDTPIVVTMRFHQESGEAIDRVCGVRNTAGLNLAYAIGAKSQESVSKTYTDAANCDADSSIGLPKARITKQVQRAEIVQNPNTGDYVVTVEAEATNPKSNSLTVSAGSGAHYTIVFENISGQAENLPAIEAPILVDTLPRQAMAVKAEATSDNAALKLTTAVSQDGYTVVVRGDGRLEAGQKITLTVDALFVGERILEQIIAHNTGMDANIAYAMSGVQTVKNTKNPFGVPFVDEAGNEITGMVKQQPGDSQSGELPDFEGQHGISAKAEHRSAEPSALTISKYVAGTITGKNKFVSGSNVAVTGAKTEKDNEINRIYYRILVENPSLSPAASVAVMDELPHTDDWRNDSSTRDSKWDVALESTAISVTKYAADGSSTELKPGEDYTVYFTQKKITSQNRNTYNDYFGADNIRKSWAKSMAPADVHGFAVMLTQPLAAKERVLIEYTCSAPEVTDSSVYFTTANNIARLSYDQHSGVASDVARVAIIPEKVWLGNRVWIDFNGDGIQSEDLSVEPNYAYTGEGKQLTMQLSQRYNRYRPTTQTQTITDGSYQFDELFAAVKLASLKNDPNDLDGNVVATNLSGSERYTYQLTLSGIPESFRVTRKGVNNPIASDKDSDFVADGNGGAATKWFYLPVPTEEMVKNDQLGYQQVDVGLVPVRDLKITKEADNDADVSDAVFAIYGPYTTEELDNLTAVSAAKKVGEMTSSGNVYSFVSTQSAYLTYADSYLVVETSAPAPYLSTGATFSGEGIAAHDEVEIGGEKHSCFVLEGMNRLPGDFKADSRKTYYVNATDLYSAAGTYMLTAQKKVFAEETQVELERYANLFRIWVTSPDDPNLTKRVAAGGNVTVEENAVFVQADENGKFDLTMNYATIPETGWTQRDWEGMTYTYQIEEVDTAFDGVTYDKTKYTVTVTLEDDGQGHLTPNAKISGGEDGSIVLKNKLARRDLTISKTTAGNAVLSSDAFTVKIGLSRNDIVPVDGDYPMDDGAAETTLTVKNGEATLKIRDGQTVTIKDIPVGTAYTVEETDERAQGYNIDASAYTSGGSGVIATDKEAKVELKNVRNAGSLTIRKKIEGKDPISEREFSFTAAITYPAGVDLKDADNLPKIPTGSQMTVEVEKRTVTIKDIRIAVSQTKPDANVTIGNILYGASYTVTENDGFAEWGYAAYYDENMKFGESTPNRVVNAKKQTALFTNVRSAGKLKIGKTATGTGVGKGLAANTETYNVKLTLVNETVSLNGHVGRSNMPSEGEKTTYPVKQEQVGQEVTLMLSLHNGEVVTFDDLPEGTSYAVDEDEQKYRKMGFTVSYADGNSSTTEKNKGTISKETASSVQITNVRDTHSVSITKNVLGQMANEGDVFDFNVRIEKKDDALSDEAVYREYTYTVNGQTETIDFRRKNVQTISLKKGETAVIDDVPDGADIIVTEAMSEKHEDEGYTLKTTQTEKNEKPNIIGYTFTNERYIGSIEITKALAGTGSDKGYGKTFTFDVKLWNERNLDLLNKQTSTMPSGVDGLTKTNEQRDGHDVYAGTVSITMGADGRPVSASITNIPAHTCYEIVEHDYTDDGYTTQTPQNAFGIIDVVNEAGREEAMTFTNTRESGTLALSKALKGNATDGEKAFTFRVKLENARFDTATQRDAYDVVIREANKADVQTTVARDANGEYVLTLKGGQTATLLDVLYGTTATVAEDDYTAEGYEAVSTQTATVNGQTPDAAAVFTNERNVGVLSVTKNAVGNAVKFEKNGRAVFSFSATLTYADWIDLTQTNNLPTVDGKTPKNMTVDAKNHTVTLSLSIPVTEAARVGSLNVENILKGTRYAVREVFDAQDGYYLTVSTQNGRVNGSEVTGTIADALTGDAVFTNTRNVGALEITKKLEGTGYNDRVAVSNAVRTSFGFTVRLWREDGVRLTGDNRPTLNGKALALETRTENGFTYDEAHVTVDMADGAAATGEERGVTIGNILVDTHYTVIEDENGYQTEGYVVRQGEQGGVMTDAGDTLRFVNTRDTGSLEIVKNLDGRTAEFGREFEFTVTLSRNDNIALAGTYLTQSGRTVAFEDNAAGGVTARVRVAGGGSLTILGIPSGTSYTVSEADYTADRYTTTSTGAVGVVETAAVRATFLNTRANPGYGALTVTKTVEAIGGAEIPDTQFVFDIALTLEDGEDFTGTLRTTRTSGETGRLYFNGGAASIRLSHGESVTLSGIPLGTSYTVTERAAQDMRVSSTGSEGAIKGTGHMAAFVNTMTQAYTDLIVRKAWNDANDAQKLRPQSVTVDVTRNGQTITTLTLNAANRWTQTLTQLPMFDDNGEAYDYDVVENDVPEGYTASVVTRGTTFTVINTHRIDDGFVPVDPENRRRGGLTILDDLGVPLGGGINMNEGDCFN